MKTAVAIAAVSGVLAAATPTNPLKPRASSSSITPVTVKGNGMDNHELRCNLR